MILILLPAYNEERDIGLLLKRIQEVFQGEGSLYYKVFVVNDGSTDRTALVVKNWQKAMPVELIEHGKNKGLGQAMLTGLSRVAALIQDEDVLVTMDADNTHDPALMVNLVARIRTGVDLVIASRYETGGEEIGLSRYRSFLSRGASGLLKIFFPLANAKDFTCGYRAYRGTLIKRASRTYGARLVEERGFTCMAEILIKMGALGARIAEVPLVLRYDLKSGQSKMKVLRTILRYFILIARNLHRKQPAYLPANEGKLI